MQKMKSQTLRDRTLEGGTEWIVAPELAPVHDELIRLRAYVEALHEAAEL